MRIIGRADSGFARDPLMTATRLRRLEANRWVRTWNAGVKIRTNAVSWHRLGRDGTVPEADDGGPVAVR